VTGWVRQNYFALHGIPAFIVRHNENEDGVLCHNGLGLLTATHQRIRICKTA
jgi:hypothetical protein